MDEEDVLGWEKAKKVDEDMLNAGKVKALNENKKFKNKKIETYVQEAVLGNENNDNNIIVKKQNKLGLFSLIALAILLFIVGILIGNKLLEIDEKPSTSYKSKSTSEKSVSKAKEEVISTNTIQEDISQENIKENDNDEEVPIVYARYNIENPNDSNKECSVSFGKANNFSISLGKDDAYIYGEYHIDGKIITCNAVTWRNAEKQEAVNSTIKFRINGKEEVEVSEVNIFEGNSGLDLDKELINLDGLRVGIKYVT